MIPSGFLLENERGWLGSSLFFHSMLRLGIRTEPYYIPPGIVLSPEETTYYANSILSEAAFMLPADKESEAWQYIETICRTLKGWGEKNYLVHVM